MDWMYIKAFLGREDIRKSPAIWTPDGQTPKMAQGKALKIGGHSTLGRVGSFEEDLIVDPSQHGAQHLHEEQEP
jgi:hypothetical protein